MENLFAYGTLMSQEIFRAVTGVQIDSQAAILTGFSCWSVRGEVYPAIIPDASGLVQGVVYRSIDGQVWRCLDQYEGPMYTRQAVTVRLNDGTLLSASTYAWNGDDVAQLDRPGWRFSDFMDRFGADYLKGLA